MTRALRISAATSAAVGFLMAAAPLVAHHSAAFAYDESKRVEAQGTVTKVLVRNPHSWIFVSGQDAFGKTKIVAAEWASTSRLDRDDRSRLRSLERCVPQSELVSTQGPASQDGTAGQRWRFAARLGSTFDRRNYGAPNATSLLIASNAFFAFSCVDLTFPYQVLPPTFDWLEA